ncbi:hypothetical protein SUDANB145_07404 (plasmid) [Streptomyces sp. enrichment culture]|uniref:hypothetical protein n=1 Tax=Streptomyces sp. enrichment culture TaxID=1795815 RepID=UPI003F5725A7
MAQESWPSPGHNSRNVTDVEYEQLAARFSDDGIYGDPSDTAVVSAGTGLSVNVRAGATGSLRGHGWTSGTSTVTLPVDANSSGSTRRDRVVLRLDRSDWTVRAAVKTGSPGPWLPSLTQDTGDTGVYEIPLAVVTVLSGAASVTVTRGELYVGGRFRPCTSTTRDPNPRPGDGCVETDTGRVRVWNGSSWGVVYSDSGTVNINNPLSAWDITTDSVLEERNGNVHLRLGSFRRAAGDLSVESRLPVLIPAAYRHPTRDHYITGYVTGVRIARMTVYSAASDRPGQVWVNQHSGIDTGQSLLTSGASWVV